MRSTESRTSPAKHLVNALGFLANAASELRVSGLAPEEYQRLLALAEALRVVRAQTEAAS